MIASQLPRALIKNAAQAEEKVQGSRVLALLSFYWGLNLSIPYSPWKHHQGQFLSAEPGVSQK